MHGAEHAKCLRPAGSTNCTFAPAGCFSGAFISLDNFAGPGSTKPIYTSARGQQIFFSTKYNAWVSTPGSVASADKRSSASCTSAYARGDSACPNGLQWRAWDGQGWFSGVTVEAETKKGHHQQHKQHDAPASPRQPSSQRSKSTSHCRARAMQRYNDDGDESCEIGEVS